MSYILDALRKSEQERLRAGVPGLHSPPPAPLETPVPHRPWQALAVLFLALNAGALGWWLASRPGSPAALPPPPTAPASQPRSVAPAAPIPTDGPAPPPAAVAHAEPPAPLSVPQLPMATPQPDHSSPRPPSRPESPTGAGPATPPSLQHGPRNALPAASARPPSVPPVDPEEAPAPAPPKGIVAFADLPAVVRKALPPLQIGGYAEGAGGDVMLVVNDRLVSEGEEIGGGVRVLKISPDGTVFGYRGYRFRR